MSVTNDELFVLIDEAVSRGLLTGKSDDNLKLWLTEPCYANTYRDDIAAMLQEQSDATLESLNEMFWTTIPFGTGGRRGLMAAMGPATINDRTIAESAHGLAAYMKLQKKRDHGVAVVAHDTRNNSQRFAKITASTLAAHGLKVYVFAPHPRVVALLGEEKAKGYTHRSTPLLSFAARYLKCDIGAMISASHNPPQDNGFKAYWDTGGQVVTPHDKGIIECVMSAREIPSMDYDEAVAAAQIVVAGPEVDDAFIAEILKLGLSDKRDVNAIFSPLHGVGETSAFETLHRAGFAGATVFGDQQLPDGGFPNVDDHFPNPERGEVFTPILDHIKQSNADCDVVLATDPDADRVAICVRNSIGGEFEKLTGNQTGALLCDYVLGKRKVAGTLSDDAYVLETLVTTPLIKAIADGYGVTAVSDLLVGFKYIAETMDERGPSDFVFGAEESLGYLAGEYARDKDASIACLYILELAAELKAAGKTLTERLNELYVKHGVHIESQTSIVCKGPTGADQIKELMRSVRSSPPKLLAGLSISDIQDFATGELRDNSGAVVGKFEGPTAEMVIINAGRDGAKISVAARPSGTEPKIKFYFFGQQEVPDGTDVSSTFDEASSRIATAEIDLQAWADGITGS